MCRSVPQIPVIRTRMSTSLIPGTGSGTASSHSPRSALLLTSARKTSLRSLPGTIIQRFCLRFSACTLVVVEEAVLGKAYDARLMRRLLAYLKPYKAVVGASLFFLLIASVLEVMGPLLTKLAIDKYL